MSRLAATEATIALTADNADQAFEPDAMTDPFSLKDLSCAGSLGPRGRLSCYPGRRTSEPDPSAAASRCGRRVPSTQYGVGSAGSCNSIRTLRER